MVTRHTPPIEAQLGKEIQVRTPDGALVSWDDYDPAHAVGLPTWESDGTEDIQPSFPHIKVVQGSSTMQDAGKHGGEFWRSDTGEFVAELHCVALMRRQTRALFSNGEEKPQCMSVDGRTPLPRQPLWNRTEFADQKGNIHPIDFAEPETCAACPLSLWGDDGTPSLCGMSDNLLLELEDKSLADLRVSGKSLKPERQFIAQKCTPKHIPLYAYHLTLTTDTFSEPGRHWSELRFSGVLMPPAQARAYSDRLKAERARFETGLAGQGATAEWVDGEPLSDEFEE